MSDASLVPASTVEPPRLSTSSVDGYRSTNGSSSKSSVDEYNPLYIYPSGAIILVLGVMGIVGNILLLCVMKRPHLKNKSYAHFLSALAICDTINILFNFFKITNYIAYMQAGRYLTAAFEDVGCKIYDFVERIFVFNSAWLIVCITVERFLVIYFPCRGRIFCRAKKALAIVLLICVLSIGSQAVRLAWVVEDDYGLCSFEFSNAEFASNLDVFFESILFYLAPSFTILILNVLTLIRMNGFIRSSSSGTVTTITQNTSVVGSATAATAAGYGVNDSMKNEGRGSLRNSALCGAAIDTAPGSPVEPMNPQQKLLQSGARENCTASTTSGTGGGVAGSGTHQLLLKYFPRLRRNSRRATWILLTISFTYLLCCLPHVVGHLYWHIKVFVIKAPHTNSDHQNFMKYFFSYRFVLMVFLIISYSSNFYTYLLFGKSFRKEVTSLLNFSSSSGAPPNAMGNGHAHQNPPPGQDAPVVMMRLPGAPGHYGPGQIVIDPPPPDILVFNKLNGKCPQFPLADYKHHAPALPPHPPVQTRYRHMPEFPI